MKNEIDISEMIPIIEESLKNGNKVKFKVRGNSMYPTLIEQRDSVFLERKDKYKKYDIILYRRDNGHYVLHRIIGTKNGCFKLCGDNQTEIEYPIRENQIVAAATAFERKGSIIDANDFKYNILVHIWTNFIFLRPFMMKHAMKRIRMNKRRKKRI